MEQGKDSTFNIQNAIVYKQPQNAKLRVSISGTF